MTSQRHNLVDILLTDLTRNFVRVLLFLAVMASAFGVVLSAQYNRQLSIQVEALMQEQDRLIGYIEVHSRHFGGDKRLRQRDQIGCCQIIRHHF